MNVLFYNCTTPLFAAPLDAFIAAFGHRAFHIKDVPGLPRGRHSTDLEWIEHLRRDRENWFFVSGDARLMRNPAARAALRSAGLHGFILSPAYQKTPLNQVAATILWKWPEMENITKILAPPSMHEIPIGRIRKLRPLPLKPSSQSLSAGFEPETLPDTQEAPAPGASRDGARRVAPAGCIRFSAARAFISRLAAALSALRVVVASKFGLGLADGFGQALQF